MVIARCPWFLPVGIVAVWQLASSVGWLSTRILPSPEGVVTAFWTLSASGELWQHLAISSWRALIGFSIYLNSDVAQRAASGADPAGDFVVWH
ncbi:putative aliphatic sulfonates ABC transporter permease [Escherichia coli]|uniref:Putative aliphatic sulfonates ABC transporter permease n=1 Tax=Escherichia coli TaxID=562 RepID=A0A376X0N7_ECOLX|nr:putative aliphatic sulfonates ABC transporter permease [Escherichia coli]